VSGNSPFSTCFTQVRLTPTGTSKQNIYKRISRVAKEMLDKSESHDIEFKRSAGNIKGEDLVAFANSDIGGTILIGVDEYKDTNGQQKGKVVGCKVGDEEKLSLMNRAQQCSPPVEIDVILENASKLPFYRVEIPSGTNKPYCSSGGTYKIRRDGLKQPLLPQHLLQIFMAEESGKFLQKFEESTIEMREELAMQNQDLIKTIIDSTEETEEKIQGMLSDIESNFDMVAKELKSTEEEINHNLEQVITDNEDNTEYQDRIQSETKSGVRIANDNIVKLAWKLNALLEKFDIEDPEITERRNFIKGLLAIQLSRPTGVVGNYTVEWFIETPDDAILEKLFHSISLPNGTIFD